MKLVKLSFKNFLPIAKAPFITSPPNLPINAKEPPNIPSDVANASNRNKHNLIVLEPADPGSDR